MEDIISMIEEAERRAAEIKQQAKDRALSVVTDAEKRAMEITKAAEVDCAELRENILRDARIEAEQEYDRTLAECNASAKAYADALLEHVEPQVAAIVGRIVK